MPRDDSATVDSQSPALDIDFPHALAQLMARGQIAMYRVGVEPRAQEDIAATVAAHRELGPGFEEGLAEGLVERIGAEIDKRVDALLGQRGIGAPTPAAPAQAPSGRPAGVPVAMALGSMLMAVLGTVAAVKFGPSGSPALAALIWVVIGIINVAYARRR